MDAMVLEIPRCKKTIYIGTVKSAAGINNPAMMIPVDKFFPGKVNFAKEYPAITEIRVPMAAAVVE